MPLNVLTPSATLPRTSPYRVLTTAFMGVALLLVLSLSLPPAAAVRPASANAAPVTIKVRRFILSPPAACAALVGHSHSCTATRDVTSAGARFACWIMQVTRRP